MAAAGSPGEFTFPSDCPNAPLIVASSSDNHRLASFAKRGDDYVYAPGSIPYDPISTPTSCPSDQMRECKGTAVSAGQVSGFVAYLLSLSAELGDNLPGYDSLVPPGLNFKRWQKMHQLLLYWSYSRLGDQPGAVDEIWNGAGHYCPGSNQRMKARDGTEILCTRPSSSTSTVSTIPTHHAPNNNGPSTLTTLSTLISSIPTLRTSTSTSSVYPAWPSVTSIAGFHIIGYSSTSSEFPDASLGVVGSANDNCRTIVNNQAKYGAYGFLGDGSDGEDLLIGDVMYPNYVNSSTTQFYLLPETAVDPDGPGLPLCGVSSPKNFRLSFLSTWTTNGPGSFGKETSYLMLFCPDGGANRVK